MIADRNTVEAIREALSTQDTLASVEGIKRAVRQSLEAVDSALMVEDTDYFNHSYAPDFVLQWEGASTLEERLVFLRFNENPLWIADELTRLGERHPLVYGLRATPEDERTERLDEEAVETDSLVADPVAIDRLAAVPPAGLESFISRSFVRGGRGVANDARTERTRALVAGFESARAADPTNTRTAVDVAQHVLRAPDSGLLMRFLQAMWVSSGKSAAEFPAEEIVPTDPGSAGLKFLIDHEEIDDRDFWRAMGKSLTLERLLELEVSGAPPNLGHIVDANLDRIWARACRVRPDQQRLDTPDPGFTWRIEYRLLAFSASDFTAYFTPNLEDIDNVKVDKDPTGLTLTELRKRAQSLPIDGLELASGERLVSYRSPDATDVVGDEQLAALAEALGSAVQRASITVNHRHLELDFTTATASARTSGQPPLADLLRSALPLLWPILDSERRALDSLVAESVDQQALDLFTEPE